MKLNRCILRCLKPLKIFIRTLEGDKYVTISHVPTLLKQCFVALESIAVEDGMINLANCLAESISHPRLGSILKQPNLSLCAAVFDPRFGHLNYIETDLRDKVWDTFAHWAYVYNDVFDQSEAEANSSTLFPIPREALSFVSLSELKDELRSFRIISEEDCNKLQEAIQHPLINWIFCFERSVPSRCLKPLLLCLFSILATSASSERMFPKAGQVISRRRSKTLPAMAQDLVLISEWSKQPQFKFMECLTVLVLEGDSDDYGKEGRGHCS